MRIFFILLYMIVLYASILFDHSIKESDSKGKPIVTWVKRTAFQWRLPHCPNNDQNLSVKNPNLSRMERIQQFLDFRLLFTYVWHRIQTYTVASAPPVLDKHGLLARRCWIFSVQCTLKSALSPIFSYTEPCLLSCLFWISGYTLTKRETIFLF